MELYKIIVFLFDTYKMGKSKDKVTNDKVNDFKNRATIKDHGIDNG